MPKEAWYKGPTDTVWSVSMVWKCVLEKDVIRDKIENTDFLPDQFDRYNFCAVCEKDFASRSSYREHLQNVHKMKLLPFRKKSVRFPTTLKPDPHNSHFYCRVCARKCSTRSTYRIHLFYVRNIVLEPLKGPNRVNPNIQPDEDDSNNYCASCEIKFCHNYRYRKRLQKIHKMTLKPRETVMKARRSIDIICTKRKRLQSNVNPDSNDPNFYCEPCHSAYADKSRFHQHIGSFHKKAVLPSGAGLFALLFHVIVKTMITASNNWMMKLLFWTRSQ